MTLKLREMLMSNEHYAYYPFAYFLEQQAAMGSKCLELFLAPPHVWVDWRGAEGIAELREKIQAAGLRVDAVRAEGVSQRYAPFAAEEERGAPLAGILPPLRGRSAGAGRAGDDGNPRGRLP